MLSIYPACFFKEDNGYSVIFPDLNYLATQGDTLEDAVALSLIHIYRNYMLCCDLLL